MTRYLFRYVAYKSKTIRFVKPLEIDSDGDLMASNIAEMQVLSQYLEYRELPVIVIALLSRSIIGCSGEDKTKSPVLRAFQQEYQCLPDRTYEWKVGEMTMD